jgi:hypothetical protein
MDAFLKDIKHSIRMFIKNPSFTLTAIAALTLGIGANTAIFSIVNTVLLKPVPFPERPRSSCIRHGSGNAESDRVSRGLVPRTKGRAHRAGRSVALRVKSSCEAGRSCHRREPGDWPRHRY